MATWLFCHIRQVAARAAKMVLEDAFATIILGEGEVVAVAMVSLERAMAMAVS